MEIRYFDEISSTQTALCDLVRSGDINNDLCIVAKSQTQGIGSRLNEWESKAGNLYFSFCMQKNHLPSDLPVVSASIYFAFILKEILAGFGSKIWLKWPNDFYLNDKKIGGVMTNKLGDFFVCGMGINLVNSPKFAAVLDIKIEIYELLEKFFKILEKKLTWKQIFSKFLIEFQKSKEFITHNGGKTTPLKEAVLCEDGSILINGERIYSLR